MKLGDSVVKSFRVAKVFRENTDRVNSIDFAPNGEALISASDDDSIVIYDCASEGKPKRTLYSKKYGVDHINYTHAGNTVIYASNKVDDAIRYQSLHDNKYIRYFNGHTKKVVCLSMSPVDDSFISGSLDKSIRLWDLRSANYAIRYQSLHDNKYIRYFNGHTKKVVCLSMSPVDDSFISGSLDKSIRLWDLRSANCQGLMHMPGRPVAAFDPEGLIFAAGINSEMVKLYDLRSFDKGPFITFRLQQDKDCDWTGLKFSPDGKMILISTNGTVIRLIDAFQGQPLQTFMGHLNTKGLPLEASFSPDAQYVLSGSQDGQIHVWNSENGSKTAVLDGKHPDPLQCVQFNPRYMMLASACSNMAFWLPTVED